MRIVVTGGTGFTGKALVRRLLGERHEVLALNYQEGFKTVEIKDWGALSNSSASIKQGIPYG